MISASRIRAYLESIPSGGGGGDDLRRIQRDDSISIQQFKGGLSNPTYLITYGTTQRVVLRTQPTGVLLPGAHLIDREYKAIQALYGSPVPVPRPYVYCADKTVIGTPFYLMEYIDGRIFRDPRLPSLSPNERHDVYMAILDVLVALHSIKPVSVGLHTLTKRRGNFVQRQMHSWTRAYRHSQQQQQRQQPYTKLMDALIEYFDHHHTSNQAPLTIVHGDFRMDNVVFDRSSPPRVLAILDWELASLGDPFVDLANFTLPLYSNISRFGQPAAASTNDTGIPSCAGLLHAYCRRMGIKTTDDWPLYQAFTAFRTAAICASVLARVRDGQLPRSHANFADTDIVLWAQEAARLLDTHSAAAGSSSSSPSELDEWTLPALSPKCIELRTKLLAFMNEYVYPNERDYDAYVNANPWRVPPIMERLKKRAKHAGLWNLFLLPESGLTNVEYAHLAEIMGRNLFAAEIFNCQFPDTGNMETLHIFGSAQQKQAFLQPLLAGDIRSSFVMTEPAVASSDATNISLSITRAKTNADGGDVYVLNGRKWWISGAGDPRCTLFIVMGRTSTTNARHRQHSVVLVPSDTPGITLVRPMTTYGYDDSPSGHFEVDFDNVRVPVANLLFEEGAGFHIAQTRLGPGRIHHCMRTIGLAERALELMIERVSNRKAFGRTLSEQGTIRRDIADSRIWITQTRLLCLYAARCMDVYGAKAARKAISMIKVEAPVVALRVIDRAIQAHGAAGLSDDFGLCQWYSRVRQVRFMDGPDEVHRETIAKLELRRQSKL